MCSGMFIDITNSPLSPLSFGPDNMDSITLTFECLADFEICECIYRSKHWEINSQREQRQEVTVRILESFMVGQDTSDTRQGNWGKFAIVWVSKY